MANETGDLQVLAAMIAREIKGAPPKPKLRLIEREDLQAAAPTPVFRECRLDRIRWLARTYGLQCLVRQATYGKAGLDVLERDELIELHADMEKGRECCIEGISLDEAGLIRHQGEL